MQPQASSNQPRILSTRLEGARNILRNFRREIQNPFRKSEDSSFDTPLPAAYTTNRFSGSEQASRTQASSNGSDTSSSDSSTLSTSIMDGTTDKNGKRGQKVAIPHVTAIFVHAGAGYHSTTNEHMHLGACDNAARMAMAVLRAGGTAVDAVEAAIRCLEDNEITNAGFGSNLTIDGVVEGDATMVDYLGRSGACGATAQVKNPIHLARVILDASSRPLSLRRVPPNLLVAQGATDFAYEQGIPVVLFESLVSKNARDRFVRWREDLHRAEGRLTPASSHNAQAEDLDHVNQVRYQTKQRRDHTLALLNGTWNEGQPDSPSQTPSPGSAHPSHTCSSSHRRTPSPGSPTGYLKRPRFQNPDSYIRTHSLLGPSPAGSHDYIKSAPNVAMSLGETARAEHTRPGSSDGALSPAYKNETSHSHISFAQEGTAESPVQDYFGVSRILNDEDLITDTVGAIAIDRFGHIAAGSSSGGIGMKHRGRVGPAALVGVGSAVVPEDEFDDDRVSVAAVTSGTGEHMATTMASQKCADRLYHNTRRGTGGVDIIATEEEAIESFVQADFMGHPGVSGSSSMGAIGVMAVKKTAYGYFLHFAHNTDSFALASMHSSEKDPKCVMSRLGVHSPVVQGGRKIRVE